MATIRRRGEAYQVAVARKGVRLSATFDTHAEAEAWGIQRDAEIIGGQVVKREEVTAAGPVTVADLFLRYAREESPKKGGARWEKLRLASFGVKYDSFRHSISKFTPPEIARWRDIRLGEVSASTVNREMNLISAVMRVALKEWHIAGLTANPVHSVGRPAMPRPRKQRVSAEDRKTLTDALEWDGETRPQTSKQWTAFALALAIETAMRRGEICAMTWEHVHLDQRRIHLPHTKNGYERDVPLSSAALALMRILKAGKIGERVIKVTSGNLSQIMRDVRIETGLRHVRFHDARREAATNMSKRLANVLELGAVTGHRDLRTLRGYYAPDAEDLADKLG